MGLSATQRRVRRQNYEAMLNRNRRETTESKEQKAKASEFHYMKKESSMASTAAASTRPSVEELNTRRRKSSGPAAFRIGDSHEHREFQSKDVAGIQVRECDEKTDLEGLYDENWNKWSNVQHFNISSPPSTPSNAVSYDNGASDMGESAYESVNNSEHNSASTTPQVSAAVLP